MPTLTIRRDGTQADVPFEGTPLLVQVLAQAGFAVEQPCGGRGLCQKCALNALTGAITAPTPAERRAGVRLACQARLLGDATVILPARQQWAGIETTAAPAALGCPMPGRYGAAIDLGTTTLVARVFDLQTGAALGEHALVNPQTAVAADVMGRISAAMNGALPRLEALAQAAVRETVAGACAQAGLAGVQALTVAGNTVMLYLLTARNPQTLAVAPFEADWLFGELSTLNATPAYLPPCAGAYMGADLTCAALATGLCEQAVTTLLMDIGTNGELMLWHKGQLYAASAPAGPAFEGGEISQGCGGVQGAIDRVWAEGGALGSHVLGAGPAIGICGSGLIDAVATLLSLGLVDATGAADAPAFHLRDGVYITAGDIRAVQLAKAAIAAATEILLAQAGAQPADVKQLWLAGGFGSRMSVPAAAAIGLIPPLLAPKARTVGNAALAGATALLLDTRLRAKAEQIAQNVTLVQLGGNAAFETRFLANMDFPLAQE